MKSCLKEHFLNIGGSGVHDSYEEELSEEGLRKKDLITGPSFVLSAVLLALFPLFSWEPFHTMSEADWIAVVIMEAVALGLGGFGVMITRNAIKKKSSKE